MTYAEIQEKLPSEYEARVADKLRYRYPRGESYLDVIARLEPVTIELERQRAPVLIIAHQAVLRCLWAYFMSKKVADVPHLDMPLHTVVKIAPSSCAPRPAFEETPLPPNERMPDVACGDVSTRLPSTSSLIECCPPIHPRNRWGARGEVHAYGGGGWGACGCSAGGRGEDAAAQGCGRRGRGEGDGAAALREVIAAGSSSNKSSQSDGDDGTPPPRRHKQASSSSGIEPTTTSAR